MALKLRTGAKRSSSLGALFVSNPRKRKNAPKKRKATKRKSTARKRRTTARKRKSTTRRKPMVLKLNPLHMKKRKPAKRKNVSRKRSLAAKKAAKTRKKNALALKRRKNALALKRRKNGTKKGMVRKSARRAYKKNAKRVIRRYIRNPEDMAVPLVQKPLSKYKLAKKYVVPFIGASIFGMAVVVPYMMGSEKISSYIQQSKLPQWVKTTDKFGGLFLGGLALSAVSYFGLSATKLVKKSTAMSAARAIAVLSGAAQFMKIKKMYDAGEISLPLLGKKAVVSAPAPEGTGALAFMGDGMAYDVVPMSGAHMNGMHMGGYMYGDASMMDATQAPHDLSHKELAVAKRGAMSWARCWGECPHRASSHDGCSRYAGKHGHRWGWLIKVLGWDRFAKLCKMSAPDRIRAISQIKISCINAAQKSFDSSKSMSGLAVDMGGLAYNSDSYSGLAMIGSAH